MSGPGPDDPDLSSPFLIFCSAVSCGAIVGHGGGHEQHDRRSGRASSTASRICLAVSTGNQLGAKGRRLARCADERHLGAQVAGSVGQGVAHLARRAVAQKADRVQRLARAAGGDHDPPPGQRPRRPSTQRAASRISSGSAMRPRPLAPEASRPFRRARPGSRSRSICSRSHSCPGSAGWSTCGSPWRGPAGWAPRWPGPWWSAYCRPDRRPAWQWCWPWPGATISRSARLARLTWPISGLGQQS